MNILYIAKSNPISKFISSRPAGLLLEATEAALELVFIKSVPDKILQWFISRDTHPLPLSASPHHAYFVVQIVSISIKIDDEAKCMKQKMR